MDTQIFAAIVFFVVCGIVFFASKTRNPKRLSNESAEEFHNRLYKEAYSLMSPYLCFQDMKSKNPATYHGSRELSQGITKMRTVVDMNPWNWAAFWILGKGYQAQGRSYEACDAFSRAYAVQEQNAEVAQEYMVECLHVGKTKKAVDLAHAALQLRPDEAGLKANLALCLLIDAQNMTVSGLHL